MLTKASRGECGTQFTRFTGTKVRILTQKTLLGRGWARIGGNNYVHKYIYAQHICRCTYFTTNVVPNLPNLLGGGWAKIGGNNYVDMWFADAVFKPMP